MQVLEGPRYNMYTNETKSLKGARKIVNHGRPRSNKRNERIFSPARVPKLQAPHFMPVGEHDTASAGLLVEVAQILLDSKLDYKLTLVGPLPKQKRSFSAKRS